MICRTFARPFVSHAALAACWVLAIGLMSMTTATSAAVAVVQDASSVLTFANGTAGRDSGWIVTESGPTTLELRYDLFSLQVSEVWAADQRWQRMEIDGASWHGAVGEPELPVVSRLVAVPPGHSLAVLEVTGTTTVVPNLHLFPAQEPGAAEFSFRPEAYRKQTPAAAAAADVQVGRPAILAGQTVVPLTIRPVRYDAVSGEATVHTSVQIRVAYEPDPDAPAAKPTAARKVPRSFARQLATDVLGYNNLQGNPAAKTGAPDAGLGTYVAVHSGHSDVRTEIEPLLTWRRQQGYHVQELDISQAGGTATGIKSALQAIYADNSLPPLEFVTIFGDVGGDFPVPSWTENLSGYHGGGDHYYTTLDGDDILSDVHVGRVSVRDVLELRTVVAKILGYEKTPPLDDTSWFGRACLQGDPSASGITTITTNQWLKGQLQALGWSKVDTTWSGNFASAMVGQVGQGVSVYGYRGYLGTSGINNGHVGALNNGGRLAMALLPTCDSGSFVSSVTSRSEAWLRAPNGGAVAAVGTATIGTHTRYNNCYYLGAWDDLLNGDDHRIGVAHTQGKVDLYKGYFLAEPNRAEIWAVWNNVMGDGATEMWTAVPRALDVTYPSQVSLGAQAVTFVASHDGQPVAGARVTLYRAAEGFQRSGLTDESGQVLLDLPALAAGPVTVTVTGHDYLPHQSGFTVGPVDVFCAATGRTIADDGDGLLTAGETVALTPLLTNHGTTDAFGVSAEVTVNRGPASLTGGSLTFPTIVSGTEVSASGALTLAVDKVATDGDVIELLVTASDGTATWTSLLTETVRAAAFTITDLDLADFGGRIDPGESGRFDLTLQNVGSLNATAVSAILTVDSPWVVIADDTADFGDIATAGTGRDLVAPFALSFVSDCFGGHVAPFELMITYSDGLEATAAGAVTVGIAAGDQPTGPDAYGYYAFDNTDTASGMAPTYAWVGIDPDHGAQGTDLGLTDFDWEEDATKTVDLPFAFGFYGKQYTEISICSNGWLAMGRTPIVFYRNFPLPASHSPGAMIAPFWDNLNQTGDHRVYTWYDETEHRFIIQWYRMPNHYSGSEQNFQVILLDPAFHPSGTGDGLILFQYETVANTDARDGYATVGIQNLERTVGLNYTYWNQYNPGAAPLAAGRAILFAPSYDIALPSAAITPGALGQTLAPEDQAVEYLHIANNGQEGSSLNFAVNKIDPLTQAKASAAADGDDPVVTPNGLAGSFVSTTTETYTAGTTVALPLHLSCSSPDDEWLQALQLNLPDGVTVTEATGFPAQGGEISWNSEVGDGVTTTWGTAGGNNPFLADNETSDASVTLMFGTELFADVVIDWALQGDNWGNPPHNITGQIVLASLGPAIAVTAPAGGEMLVLGEQVEVVFNAVNGPTQADIDLQREVNGPWQSVAVGVPVSASPWSWTVSGDPGPYARIRVSDAADAAVFGLSGVFSIGRNLDWLQLPVTSGAVAAGQTVDVAVNLDATGLAEGLYEAQLHIAHNGGAPVVVPVALTVSNLAAAEVPRTTALLGNHPNPFNPVTLISFNLASPQDVRLRVYSPRGGLVRELLAGSQPAGVHRTLWDGRDDRGHGVASGVYFYRLETETGDFTGKMVLTK